MTQLDRRHFLIGAAAAGVGRHLRRLITNGERPVEATPGRGWFRIRVTGLATTAYT